MSKEDFLPQTVVRRKTDGSIGVVCPDLPGMLNCHGPDEVGVVYDGCDSSDGTDWKELEVIGPENAVADLKKCGAGREKECCIFLTMGGEGLSCQRFGSLRWDLIFRKMKAERNPEKLYPHCQF